MMMITITGDIVSLGKLLPNDDVHDNGDDHHKEDIVSRGNPLSHDDDNHYHLGYCHVSRGKLLSHDDDYHDLGYYQHR